MASTNPGVTRIGHTHALFIGGELPTLPFRFAGIPRWARSSAPRLGEHNDDVLRVLLRLDDADIANLAAKSVISTQPLPSNPTFDM